jgi:hypothetical protein
MLNKMYRSHYYKNASDFTPFSSSCNIRDHNYHMSSFYTTVPEPITFNEIKSPMYNDTTDLSYTPNNTSMIPSKTEYSNHIHPTVWGPPFWFTLHNSAASYPINPSSHCAKRMKGFILGIPVMLPCEKCKVHAISYIDQHYDDLDKIVSSRDELFSFFVSFHNNVNKRNGKALMSKEDAMILYTGKSTFV